MDLFLLTLSNLKMLKINFKIQFTIGYIEIQNIYFEYDQIKAFTSSVTKLKHLFQV